MRILLIPRLYRTVFRRLPSGAQTASLNRATSRISWQEHHARIGRLVFRRVNLRKPRGDLHLVDVSGRRMYLFCPKSHLLGWLHANICPAGDRYIGTKHVVEAP
jgi:hypothetical protein